MAGVYWGAEFLMIANIIRNAKKTVTGGDPYYSAVSLLLPMDGTNGSTAFTDSGPNALTVTAVGNTQISTTQSKYGGASGYFDGTGDYLSISPNTAINLSSSDFTIEFWIRPAPKTNAVDAAFGYSNYACMFYHNGTNWTLEMSSTGFSNQLVISFAVTLNTWQHIAIVRSGTSVVVYKDGVSSASGTFTGTVATSGRTLRIGDNGNSQNINGYIDDFRISLFARYVSTFTPPTAALPTTASSTPADPYYGYTSILLHMDGSNASTNFVDSGPNTLTVTSSSVTISDTGSKIGFGQCGSFPGSSSSALTIPASSVFNFGTGNFTMEFWFNIPAGASGSPYGKTFVSSENNVWSAGAFSFYALASSTVFRPSFWINEFSSSVPILLPTSGDYRDGNWHHLAVVRSGSAFSMYIDGSLVASGTHAGNCGSSTRNLMIGDNLANNGGDRNFLGKLDDLRITKGVARYTSAFTPPTAAFPNS